MTLRLFTVFAFPLLLTALPSCSSSSTESDPTPDPSPGIRLHMESRIEPGQEAHRCQYVKLPETGGEILVSGRSHHYAEGSHHFTLYRTSLQQLEPGMTLDQPFDCFDGDADKRTTEMLAVEQVADGNYEFPEGVALPFASGELLMLHVHYINPAASPLDAKLDVELRTMPAADVKQRAGLLKFYDPFIVIPAQGSAVAQLECGIPKDITLLDANPHMHRRGVDYQAFIDIAGSAAGPQPLVQSRSWEHPAAWRGSLDVPAGSTVRLQCAYENHDPVEVFQGQSAQTDEMCMFFGYYYPAMDDRAAEGCYRGAGFGTGDKTCAETTACIQSCPPGDAPRPTAARIDVGECFQRCMVSSCRSAGALLSEQTQCIGANCKEECDAGGDTCIACVTQKCAKEAIACQTTPCQ